jgi:hypothetical protein
MRQFVSLMSQSLDEAYRYFDKNIRALPKDHLGNFQMYGPGFADNDVDAFRHAYVSGRYAMVYNTNIAKIFGILYEMTGLPSSGRISDKNMDYWNNAAGRKYFVRRQIIQNLNPSPLFQSRCEWIFALDLILLSRCRI